jgi:uncharacterized protein (UPF0335 family)
MSDGINDTQLKSLVERLTRLHEQRKEMADDIADVLKEAAGNGYDKAALKECVKIAMEDADKRQKRSEKDDTLSVYLSALGLS